MNWLIEEHTTSAKQHCRHEKILICKYINTFFVIDIGSFDYNNSVGPTHSFIFCLKYIEFIVKLTKLCI